MDENISRRGALIATLGSALSGIACADRAKKDMEPSQVVSSSSRVDRMPAVYLPHGGGPWPFMEGMGDPGELKTLADFLRSLKSLPQQKPKALLVISAHWEEPVPTVTSGERPPLFFDYSGFPPETYRITWPASGKPTLALRVRSLLEQAGFMTRENSTRGFDHGTFVPLKLTYPEAEIPTVQLSLKRGLDPAEHLAMGRALLPLRGEGVFLVGSGMSYHNMRGFFRGGTRARDESVAFDRWINDTIVQLQEERDSRLTRWTDAPSARQCHPREEHLLPLMVIAGAAGADLGRTVYQASLMGVQVSGHCFG